MQKSALLKGEQYHGRIFVCDVQSITTTYPVAHGICHNTVYLANFLDSDTCTTNSLKMNRPDLIIQLKIMSVYVANT